MLFRLWFILVFSIGGRFAGVNMRSYPLFSGLGPYLGRYRRQIDPTPDRAAPLPRCTISFDFNNHWSGLWLHSSFLDQY